jgi:hypothetical protein
MHKRKGAEVEFRAAKQEWEDIFQAIGHPSFILEPDLLAAFKIRGKI